MKPSSPLKLELCGDLNVGGPEDVVLFKFLVAADQKDFRVTHEASWPVPQGLEAHPDLFAVPEHWYTNHRRGSRGWGMTYLKDDVVVFVWLRGQRLDVAATATSGETCQREIGWLKDELFPEWKPQNDDVPVEFVYGDQGLACTRSRAISAPQMEDILPNYSQSVQEELKRLTHPDFRPSLEDGRLILWHGHTGAGKTYAVRALMRAWQSWCQSWCVLDAERFFSDPGYMSDLLIDQIDDEERDWRLLIIEDAGELMGNDAAMRSGQGLSRMLNLTDGILGQGLKSMILVTTNEPLGRLHSAASRSGRCISQQEFGILSSQEANAWLEAHGSEQRVEGQKSLADLYALLAGHEPGGDPEPSFGFVAGA